MAEFHSLACAAKPFMHNVLPMHPNTDPDPDVVAYTLQVALALVPGLTAEHAKQIEDDVKNKYGGRRFYIPKGAKRPTPGQRAAMFKDGLTRMTDSEIIEKHQISKTTLWRIMKSGGGRFS